MTEITSPILLDSTGQEICNKLSQIESAIRGPEAPSGKWILTLDYSTYEVKMSGDIDSWLAYRSKLGRYAMSNDGKARKLHRDNSRLLADGTTYDASSVHIMTRLPNLYFTCSNSGDIVTITLSESPFANCKSFGDQWVGSYLGAVVSDALVSRADINPTRSITINDFWSKAQNNGTDWGLSDYKQRQMMMIVYLCEFLSMNSQTNLGLGMTSKNGNWCEVVYNAKTGATSVLGDKCGKVNFLDSGQLVNGACHVSLFGIEDPYGWFWEFVQGVYFGNSSNEGQNGTEMFVYEGNRMPSSEELAATPSGLYRQLTRPTSSGYVKKLMWGVNADVFPSELGGSSVNGHGDYHYANNIGKVLLWGGDALYGSNCGLASAYSSIGWSTADSSIVARLAYFGLVNIIS